VTPIWTEGKRALPLNQGVWGVAMNEGLKIIPSELLELPVDGIHSAHDPA